MSQQVILCVDDESIVLDALQEQIQQSFGNELMVEIAESGDEALEIYEELTEDNYEVPLVIADFIMPGMKGDELLISIHDKNPITKKVMLTGQASIEGVGKAVNEANLYRFLAKPWDKDDLILTIKEAVRSYNQDNTIIAQNEELKELNASLEHKVEERTKELQALNATKDKFFSIIAHDLKNPFNTLMGFSELIMENIDIYDKDKIQEFNKIIFNTSKNSYILLENLLEWSRSQTGTIKMDPEPLNIYELIKLSLGLLENHASKKQIMLQNESMPNTKVYADKNMILTVLRNIMSNAIKYTEENGSITIETQDLGNMLEISIQDTGVGIKEENIDKLFRIDMNYTTKGTAEESGTGLGLILCKEFVEKNHGAILVESTYGEGSKFIIRLPKEPVEAQV